MPFSKAVTHRLQFPITKRLALAGAIMASHLSSEYVRDHVEEPEQEEDDIPMGMYL